MKFKVGDIVGLDIKSKVCLSGFETGDICKVLEVLDDESKQYRISNSNTSGYADEDELELAENKNHNTFNRYYISDYHTVDALRYAVNKMQESVEYDAKCLGIYNKGEKYMKILEIYEKRKKEEIYKKTDELVENIKSEDKVQKIIQETENQLNVMLDRTELNPIFLNNKDLYEEETENKIKEVKVESEKKIKKLNELIEEIKAQLEITENYDQKLCILVRYGVLNEQWKIDDGKEEENKSVKRKVK